MTPNPTDLRRAKVIANKVLNVLIWEALPDWQQNICIKQAAAIRASDEAAGTVLVPRDKLKTLAEEAERCRMIQGASVENMNDKAKSYGFGMIYTQLRAMLAAHEGGEDG